MDKDALLLKMVTAFAENEIAPFDMEIDRNRKVPDDLYAKILDAEFLGMNTPYEYGGADLSLTTIAKALEIIAKANASVAVILEGHFKTMYQWRRYGNEQLWQKYFPSALRSIFAFSMTEATGGSNPTFIRTTAKKVDGGYILNGSKIMITNGGLADVYTVMAKNEQDELEFFVVDKDMPGFSFTEQEVFVVLTGCPIGGIAMEDVFVPDYHKLDASKYRALNIGDSAHADARVLMGAVLAGIQSHALQEVTDYAKERQAGNQKLWELQSIQRKIADIAIGYQTTRLLYQDSAAKRDIDDPEYFLIATMAKTYGSRTAVSVGDDAMQALGAYGFSAEFPIAHLIRDARALEFAEGSVEKMRTEITKYEVTR